LLISVIVSTYNRPEALELVLSGLAEQDDAEFEVVVADDGSRGETRSLVEKLVSSFPVKLKYVWQEDLGFRAARVRNLAVEAASGSYLIFLDGDCVPPRQWVARHRALAEDGWMVAGNRVLLSKNFTERVERDKLSLPDMSGADILRIRLSGGINRLLPLVNLPFDWFRKIGSSRWEKVRTCNLAVWRKDFELVGGFDEVFAGWGYEDSDFAVRLLNSGVRHKNGAFATGVFHLYHPVRDRSSEDKNFILVMNRLKQGVTRAERGFVRPEG